MTNTVLIKRSGTANSIPSAGQLQSGELAINYADGNLFYKNSANVVTVIASNQFVSVAGNVTGGNLNAVGLSLSGNVLSVLQSTSNIVTTGNVTGNYFIGNGSQLTGITVAAGTAIVNGNSNVTVGANGNVTVSVAGIANVVVTATTGQYVTGEVSATGNITGANVNTGGLSLSGNVLSAINTTSNVTTTANISANYYLGNGALLTGIITSVSNINNGNSNVTIDSAAANVAVSVSGVSNVVVFAPTGQYVSGLISATGNITGANINGNGSGLSAITGGNVVGNVGNAVHAYFADTANSVSGGNVSGQVANALIAGTVYTNAQPNITSVGTLTSLSSSGNITGAYIFGNGAALSSITGANVIGNVGNAVHAYFADVANSVAGANVSGNVGNAVHAYFADVANSVAGANVSGQVANALIAGTVYTSFQPNITAVGVLTSLSSSGNITGSYIIGNGSTLTSITGSNVVGNVADAVHAYFADTANSVSGSNVSGQVANALVAGTVYSNAQPNITSVGILTSVSVSGNVNSGNVVTAGALSAGSISTAGNINGANIIAAAAISAASVSASGNVTGGNVNTTNISLSGNVISALNASAGIAAGTTISAVGNVTGGNIRTAGLVSATGNVNGGNVIAAALVQGQTVSATANAVAGNVSTAGLVTATGNITGGNLITTAAVSAASVSASGNVTGGNLIGTTAVVVPTVQTTGNLTVSATGNINLQPAGNITVNNTYINGVALNPVQDQDVATKYYVDTIASSGIAYHTPVTAATTDTLANITGGTVTYTQPNGVGNGIGALLTTTGSFNLIDTANVQTVGTRILVKDQANAVQNGVYTWANATNIVRSTDTDEYGPNSVEQLSVNDYFFVQGGNVNKGAAYVVNAPTGTITFGTSNITFAEFSTSQTYTANTAAGISLAGTVINAKTDGVTTAFDGGGNIIVKASANLTTPNIGAATGSSLSVTGNITGGNLNAAGLSLSSNVVSALNSTANITTTANISGGNIIGTHVGNLTGTTVSVTGNVTGGNLNATGLSLFGNVLSILQSTANITTTANISAGNVIGTLIGNLTGTTVSVTGNITGGNLNAAGLSLSSNVVSALNVTANIAGGNITTPGLISATGNITGNYFIGNGSQLTGITVSVSKISNGTSEANIGTSGGNANVSIGGVSNVAVFYNAGLNVLGNVSATGNVTPGLFFANNSAGPVTESVTQVVDLGTVTDLSVTIINNLGSVVSSDAINGVNIIDYTITSTKLANSIVLTTPNIGDATGTSLSITGNVTGGNITTPGLITATGNVTGNFFIGNGSQLTGVVATGIGVLPSLSVTGNIDAGNLRTAGAISATGTVFADKITTVSIPQVLDDISNQCDGAKMVFPLTLNLANITSANIADSKNLQVAVNGLILSPWINTQTWPWFQTFAGFPTRSPGYQVNTTASSANITFYRSPAQGSQVVLTIINSSSTTQLRKYPYSATTIVLGD